MLQSLSINGNLIHTRSHTSNTIEMLSQAHVPFKWQNKEDIFPLPFLHSSNKFTLHFRFHLFYFPLTTHKDKTNK